MNCLYCFSLQRFSILALTKLSLSCGLRRFKPVFTHPVCQGLKSITPNHDPVELLEDLHLNFL